MQVTEVENGSAVAVASSDKILQPCSRENGGIGPGVRRHVGVVGVTEVPTVLRKETVAGIKRADQSFKRGRPRQKISVLSGKADLLVRHELQKPFFIFFISASKKL